MKKTFWILCGLIILSFQFTVFNCSAQIIDSTEVQTEEYIFETDTTENVVLEAVQSVPERASLDSVQMKRQSPKKASWLALIPGAGQIYNKKYWKLPIVYGGMGATGYLIYYYGNLTSIYRKEYVARATGKTEDLSTDAKIAGMTDDEVLLNRNIYRRNMEISVAACVIVYILSIVDASVDAHLFYYDVSDNLSLGVMPKIDFNPVTRVATPSVAFVFKF